MRWLSTPEVAGSNPALSPIAYFADMGAAIAFYTESVGAATPSFALDFAAVITQAQGIFTALAPVLIGILGIALGFKVLSRVKGLAR